MTQLPERDSEFLSPQAPATRHLRVIFDWCGDRYGHRLVMHESGYAPVILRSLEGSGADLWPLSPPLQQIHFEDREGGQRVALLVGMSDKEHWSASVEIDAAGQCVTFDIACRVHSAAISLRSSYQWVQPDNMSPWKLEPLQCNGPIATVELDQENRLTILAPRAPVRTVRWKYSIALTATGLAPVV